MRSFVFFIIAFICFGVALSNTHFLKKTRTGARMEYFQTTEQQNLTTILARYLRENGSRYSVYKIPNYVDDFLNYEPNFSQAYKSGKNMALVFVNSKSRGSISSIQKLQDKVRGLVNDYNTTFNYIVRPEKEYIHYPLDYENLAYKDLREYCNVFCVIDPVNKTMFVFNKISDSDLSAIEVLFQEYDYLKKQQ